MSVQNIIYGDWEAVSMEKTLILFTLSLFKPFFLSFSAQIFHLKNIDVHPYRGGLRKGVFGTFV